MVAVLHDLNIALTYADELALLKDGRLYAKGPPQQVLTEQAVEEVFGISMELLTVKGRSVLLPVRDAGSPSLP